MPLHPQSKTFLDRFPPIPGADLDAITDDEVLLLRRLDNKTAERGAPAEVFSVTGTTVANVPVRLYRPTDEPELPVVVYLHGGGWVYGTLPQHDPMGRDLAIRTGAIIAMVDYRLAPHHVFPAAVDDAWAVVRDVFDRPAFYDAAPGKVAVAGDSAGGNLAAVTAWLARDAGLPLAHQALVYPVTDVAMNTPSYTDFASGYGLSAADMAWVIRKYAPGADPEDPRLSPHHLKDKSGLAPATLITAEYDPLRDEGMAYANALKAAGVPVDHRDFPGALHGFFTYPGFFDAADEAREHLARNLREAFQSSDSSW
ncbi:alpha/beta hydrolase [Herbidospora mongoliensis]|uniref:alpha/beta hydrolase n=1 Tax=Herbidospora mongoliensis TaxID=688067 RepID=UPI000834AD71|nr:alpha/beta hydrolase [Herbidospora mongoliensis]